MDLTLNPSIAMEKLNVSETFDLWVKSLLSFLMNMRGDRGCMLCLQQKKNFSNESERLYKERNVVLWLLIDARFCLWMGLRFDYKLNVTCEWILIMFVRNERCFAEINTYCKVCYVLLNSMTIFVILSSKTLYKCSKIISRVFIWFGCSCFNVFTAWNENCCNWYLALHLVVAVVFPVG